MKRKHKCKPLFSEEILRLAMGRPHCEIGYGIGESLGALYATAPDERKALEIVMAALMAFSTAIQPVTMAHLEVQR